MKKTIFLAVGLLLVTSCFAKKIGTWHSSYFNEDFDLELDQHPKRANDYTASINLVGDRANDGCCFYFSSSTELTNFIASLNQIKEKFVEWKQVAIDNNVSDVRKPFDIKLPPLTVAWKGSEWWFAFNQRFTPMFIVTSDGRPVCVVNKEVKSSSNQYITEKFYFALSEASDFDDILNAFSDDNIYNLLHKDEQALDLFK